MGRTVQWVWLLGSLTVGVSAVVAQDPIATPDVEQPELSEAATAPATQTISPSRLSTIRAKLIDLASEDCGKREAARMELLGLQRSDLPTLREAIRQALPLEASQAAVLRDIVTHVYLSGTSYPTRGDGFLGILLPSEFIPEQRPLLAVERGVAVVSRLPGFCSFRMLQDGDVILSLSEQPDVHFSAPQQLTDAVRGLRAGQTITFDVIRRGQIVKVPIRLDQRPAQLQANEIQQFTASRNAAAEEVWERDFAPLLAGEHIS